MKRYLFLLMILMTVLFVTPFAVLSQNDDDFEFIDDPSFFMDDEFESIDDTTFGMDDEFEFIDDTTFGLDDELELIEEQVEETEIIPDEEIILDLNNITDPDLLLRFADEMIFVRKGNTESFGKTKGYLNEILNYDVIHQYYVRDGMATDLLMTMFPSEVNVFTSNPYLQWKDAFEDEYHISVKMLLREEFPEGSGGCWLRYTNVLSKGEGSESGLILFPGREAYAITPVGNLNDLNYSAVEDLTDLNPCNVITFDFIRLDGVSYIYANKTFLFSYEDGYDGNMSFEGGAELFEDGNRIRCDFDDFTMRYR